MGIYPPNIPDSMIRSIAGPKSTIKIVGKSYKYYLTRLGRSVISCALQLREYLVIPALATSTR